ncbi:iron-siderophore ABC transporter substrate-binding protein [Actinoalloteichus hymeniacidonis]|uniref:ABC-type Fe3+-hydroxamate transport system, periplasmic component n=1 Tax=Actinoalloteichus hymeniacidonis TaxID=340345 RepID=A0AAC9MYZ7_9PSEU|nr:iron-siderophore ABC transporter substrate-binding protein [Actinoalloteichus hymeniacidonis]AOS63527.1 ABC-type Fe3+-hydroxamate transport system, periplasmic component [Actinoalloteichus hymeniacidonis]MBB5908429.1 iron complex transport system substrate-binding protein [Actinoalloteichus hymeniacidonis]
MRTTPRRRGRLAATLLGCALLMSGCGAAQERSTPEMPQADEGAFPVTISTAFGDVTIDEQPQRVVALGWNDAETALALGVQPVGAADWLDIGGDGVAPWVEDGYDHPPTMLGTLQLNIEALAELDPDLILDTRASGEQDRYDLLSGLDVPVVSIPESGHAYLTSWEDQLDMIGRAVGRAEEADRLRTELDEKFATAKDAHPEFDGATTVVAARTTSTWGAYITDTSRIQFMEKLGFVNSPAIEELADEGFSVDISHERLDLLDADLTVVSGIGVAAEEIEDDPLFQAVPSVRDGHSMVLDDEALDQAFASASVLGQSYALDGLVPGFAAAVAG